MRAKFEVTRPVFQGLREMVFFVVYRTAVADLARGIWIYQKDFFDHCERSRVVLLFEIGGFQVRQHSSEDLVVVDRVQVRAVELKVLPVNLSESSPAISFQ